jgi:esterase FrsA
MSFGVNFSAMTGLSGAVDAAVNIGGPVNHAFGADNAKRLPYGMDGILGTAFGFDQKPSLQELLDGCARLYPADLY